MKCKACSKQLKPVEAKACQNCTASFHFQCLGITPENFSKESKHAKSSWRCPDCKPAGRRGDNSDTPVRPHSQQELQNLTSSQGSNDPLEDIKDSETSELISELRLFREEFQKWRVEMHEFRAIISDLKSTVTKCNDRIDDLSARMDAVERRQDEIPSNVAAIPDLDLDRKITELKLDLNDRDQELLGNDLEISGIPEGNNEQCIHLALTVANKLGVAIEERDLVKAERAGPVRRADSGSSVGGRPRPLVVRLTRRAPRDQLLAAARVRRDVTTDGMGLNEPARRFYVNERLTRHNRQLFQRARTEALRLQWKYVWTRDGAIFARKESGASRFRLRSESDLAKVFGD